MSARRNWLASTWIQRRVRRASFSTLTGRPVERALSYGRQRRFDHHLASVSEGRELRHFKLDSTVVARNRQRQQARWSRTEEP